MRDWILPIVMVIVSAGFLVVGVLSEQDRIDQLCRSFGQFTANGVEYRCAAITQETLNESYRRQFEHCRQWLHNPWRDREMP